uniref:Putative secreted protein n=1 Tax=Ixodes ricinus TaxID=34613 RepID=A0A6B0UBD6_IXORI
MTLLFLASWSSFTFLRVASRSSLILRWISFFQMFLKSLQKGTQGPNNSLGHSDSFLDLGCRLKYSFVSRNFCRHSSRFSSCSLCSW